jgi:hypothetical protein
VTVLHDEALDESTADLLSRIGAGRAFRDFYLAGGTGLALQLGHRVSHDLDLFSERPWSPASLLAAVRALGPTVVDVEGDGALVGSVGGVRVSFFYYPYPLLEPLLQTPAGVPLARLLDTACMKLIAVSQRGSRKDFVDLYFLGVAGVDVRDALGALSRKMPGVEHNLVHLARSLAYFADAESEPEPRMLVPFRWSSARDYCLARSRAILQEILEAG